MQPESLLEKVDHLLRKPLSNNHLTFLRWVREKVLKGNLVEFDRDYILYLWDEFSASASAETVEPDATVIIDPPRTQETSWRKDEINRKAKSTEQEQNPTGVEAQLEQAKQTIARLRENGKKAVAQRDHWETLAKSLEKEMAELRLQNGKSDRRFDEAKRAFAKLYHPDTSMTRSSLEAVIRGEIFKEFWAELERIEQRSS